MWKHKLIDFIVQVKNKLLVPILVFHLSSVLTSCVVFPYLKFMEEIDKEISAMKIAINAR